MKMFVYLPGKRILFKSIIQNTWCLFVCRIQSNIYNLILHIQTHNLFNLHLRKIMQNQYSHILLTFNSPLVNKKTRISRNKSNIIAHKNSFVFIKYLYFLRRAI